MEVKEFTKKPAEGESWDVVIIGSGPSGLTSAIYTTRGAASTLILGGEKWGGQLMLTTEIDNFPAHPGILGPDLMAKMREHALMFGAEFVEKNVESVSLDAEGKIHTVIADEQEYKARSVIVATGADTRWLGIPGEDTFRGKGVSSCAPCDAPFFKDKKVVVVGGGDSAMEEALVLTKYASSVTIIHRKSEFKASKVMQHKVLNNEKVDVIWDTSVVEVMGDKIIGSLKLKTSKDSEKLGDIKNTVLKRYDGKVLDEADGLTWEMPVEGMFVAIGHTPSTKIFKGPIELDEKGYVVVHDHTKTNVKGVFVAGDVHDYHYRQAVTAAGFGCMAGMDALKYLDTLSEE